METVQYRRLSEESFGAHALDSFIRRQAVRECWRRVDGQLLLLPVTYREDWDLEGRRARAEKEPCDIQLEYQL